MASQIYARYIPPKKAKNATTTPQTLSIDNTTVAETVTSRPLSQLDASQTYARYIPPKRKVLETESGVSKRQKLDGGTEPIKVRKTKTKSETDATTLDDAPIEEPNLVANNDDNLKEEKQKVKEKKHKKQKTEKKEDESQAQKDEDSERHANVLKKRDKSLRRAEKQAERKAELETQELDEEDPIIGEEETVYDLVPLPQPAPVPESIFKPSKALPKWLADPIWVSSNATEPFEQVGVGEHVAKVLRTKGFGDAFAVQATVLPMLLPGKRQQPGDILVSAATGSGKTLAYVLPMVEDISRHLITKLRGIIVMPTRELVLQAKEVAEVCAIAFSSEGRRRVTIETAVGSDAFTTEQASLIEQSEEYDPTARAAQEAKLNSLWRGSSPTSDDGELLNQSPLAKLPGHIISYNSKASILICTPGRLVEHIKSTPGFSLEYVKWLIIDEADKLLNQAYQNWVSLVMGALAESARRNGSPDSEVKKMVLSATITRDVGQLSGLKLYRPKLVVVSGSKADEEGDGENTEGNVLPALLTEVAIKVGDDSDKPLYLMELLLRGSPSASLTEHTYEPHGVLVFTNSNASALRLARLVALLAPQLSSKIGTLTSTTPSSTRNSTIKSFNAAKLSIIVASDLVSRGLDLPNLAHVINYDIPTSVTGYVHRVGRTARAGKVGEAITLYTNTEGRWFWNEIGRGETIVRAANAKVERGKVGVIGEVLRSSYAGALEQLGQEAHDGKKKDE